MRIAVDANDRMQQPMDGQLTRSDGIGDRIDQERHVVIDDADPHAPVAGLAADRLDFYCELALAPVGGDLGDEFGRVAFRFPAQSVGFTWQGVSSQRLPN